ncbi:MAG: hypothetical protein ACC653_13265, partial [Gammaproteobacteria bacterium]
MIVKHILSSCFKSLYLFSLVFVSFDANAEKLGVRIISGVWDTRYKGYVVDKKTLKDSINLRDDLNLENSLQSFFFVYLEQPD